MDFMPYARHLQDSSVFATDFYVNCISLKYNERFVLGNLLALFPLHLWPLLFFCIHAICSITLVYGIFIWCAKFIRSDWLIWFTVVGVLIITYHFNLGGNELYYNMVCGSIIAKSLGVWALWHAYNSKWLPSAVLAVISTYFHPIAGLQVLILSAILIDARLVLKYLSFGFALISPYLYLLVKELNSNLSPAAFTEIMLIRNAHHFFPGHFGLLNYLLILPLFLIGTYLWKSIDLKLFRLSIFILAGCLMYGIMLTILPKLAIQTQWFKSTIWLKLFSLIAIIRFTSGWLCTSMPKIILIGLAGLFILFRSAQVFILKLHPILGQNPNIQHAKSIGSTSKPNDLYLVSPAFTEFKFYSGQSTYVDWKAIPHNGACLEEWYRRVKIAYGITSGNIGKMQYINEQANHHLLNLSEIQKKQLKSEGVTKIEVMDTRSSRRISIEL